MMDSYIKCMHCFRVLYGKNLRDTIDIYDVHLKYSCAREIKDYKEKLGYVPFKKENTDSRGNVSL